MTLGEAETFSIGRAVGNSLCIEDPSVSRNHCVVAREGRHFSITDRGSVNRTYINGLPLPEHTLRSGDEIKIGESLFLFVAEGEAGEEGEPASVSTNIHLASTQLLHTPGVVRFPGPAGKYLEALLAVGDAVPTLKGLEELQERILRCLCDALPAERGILVLSGSSPAEVAAVSEWPAVQNGDGQSILAASMLEQILRDPAPILWNRSTSRTVAGQPAISVGPRVSGLLAVPLQAFKRTIGALCVTSTEAGVPFSDDHLWFLTKAAGITAALVDDALSAQDREVENRQRWAAVNLEHNMIGESRRMRKVYETIAKVAPTDSTVLIRGESGTGKELAARAIHRNSLRAQKPFVAINCAALAETLLESELFGHEKGAFTGAVVQKRGRLEEAIGGTIFFDEISEMSSVLQAKLLRVLQEREFERVGGTRAIRADVRVVAATNRDLDEAIRRGTFRADLYYRLNVVSLMLPPLGERKEDIELLANHFAKKHSRKLNRWLTGISPQALAHLKSYDWPGNVRELENAIERAIVLGTTEMIQPEDLPDSVIEAGDSRATGAGGFHATITEAKKRLIIETLQTTNGNHAEAARMLELHPNSLHRIIRNLNLRVRPAT